MTDPQRPFSGDLTRRRFLQGSALAGVSAFLAACGTAGQSGGAATSTAAAGESAAPAASAGAGGTPAAGGTLRFANWLGYMDVTEDGSSYPTIEKFQDETGITVEYGDGAVDDNETFFTADLQAPLEAGQPTAWDLIVVTDWMVARLIRLGWVDAIDTSLTPYFVANLAENYKGRSFDPDTNLAAPWQSGMTGLGYDKAITGDQDSIEVLFSDEFKGKLTYLSEMRDTIGLAAIRLGFSPEELTQEQFDASLADVDKAVKDGVVRQVVGNSYVEDMAGGGVVLAIAWSGDVLTLLVPDQTPEQDFQWALPKEGGMLWTDNMVLPKGSQNKAQAERWIDFYYDPVNAATLAAWVNYICPVDGAKQAMEKIDPSIVDNELIFPTESTLTNAKGFMALDQKTEQNYQKQFAAVIGA